MLDMANTGTVRLRVSEILDERQMSTADFAARAGLTYNQALAIRRSAYERIDLGTIEKICKALSVQPSDLFVYNPAQDNQT